MEMLDGEVPKIRMFYPGIVVLTVTSFFMFWQIMFNDLVLEFSKTISLLDSQLISLSGQVMCILFMFFILTPRLELKPFFENYDDLAGKNPAIWRGKIVMVSYLIAFTVLTALLTLLLVITGEQAPSSSTAYVNHLLEYKNHLPPLGPDPLISMGVFLLVYGLIAPVFEELLFRRILIPLLSEKYPHNAAPVLISAIISASLLTVTKIGTIPLDYLFAGFLEYFISGLMFGYVFTVTRRLSATIISHSVWNLFDTIAIITSYSEETTVKMLPVLQVASFLIMSLATAVLLYLLVKKVNYRDIARAFLSLFSFTAVTNILLAMIISLFLFTQNMFLFFLMTSVGLNIILFFYGATAPDELKSPEPRGVRSVLRNRIRGVFQNPRSDSKRKKKQLKAARTARKSTVKENTLKS
ncbi:MAG: lysostaphin resistance A-like protein, partial [Candidatus Odinarchaeota archaeon]